jgi:allophanate hydrolase
LRPDGLPFGISLLAPAGSDYWLCALGEQFHASTGLDIGATHWRAAAPIEAPKSHGLSVAKPPRNDTRRNVPLAVVGAHLSGQPLNHQLTERGGRLQRSARSAPNYRLFALPDSVPPKPGLVACAPGDGAAIEVEIWELGEAGFGSFVAAIPAPLGVGTLLLSDGSSVKGFICESHATRGAEDISTFGGWRAYLQAQSTKLQAQSTEAIPATSTPERSPT